LVKLAPDLNDTELDDALSVLLDRGVDGVIATNTTLSREGVQGLRYGNEAGGLSGAPLEDLATETVEHLCQALAGKLPVIGVGGILDGEGAAEKVKAGASLVQIYSGFIYRGPELIREAVDALADLRTQG